MVNNAGTLEEMSDKRDEYTTFIERTLRPQLQIAVSNREETESEIEEYQALRSNLTTLLKKQQQQQQQQQQLEHENHDDSTKKNELESLVDLGHGIAYCRAIVPDPSTVFVHVGMGFHVEFSLDEAVRFIDRRVSYLKDDVLADLVKKATTVGNHLRGVLDIMETLDREFKTMDL